MSKSGRVANQQLAMKFEAALKHHGLSLHQLCEDTGICRPTAHAWLHGQIDLPAPAAVKLADYFSQPLYVFLDPNAAFVSFASQEERDRYSLNNAVYNHRVYSAIRGKSYHDVGTKSGIGPRMVERLGCGELPCRRDCYEKLAAYYNLSVREFLVDQTGSVEVLNYFCGLTLKDRVKFIARIHGERPVVTKETSEGLTRKVSWKDAALTPERAINFATQYGVPTEWFTSSSILIQSGKPLSQWGSHLSPVQEVAG